ncbi:unnamed protein product [Amoebophrya sp. A25]|nr:unnamed protein product [Amoebophrya sp. A25]|eukprot:GSA25T00022347001.1
MSMSRMSYVSEQEEEDDEMTGSSLEFPTYTQDADEWEMQVEATKLVFANSPQTEKAWTRFIRAAYCGGAGIGALLGSVGMGIAPVQPKVASSVPLPSPRAGSTPPRSGSKTPGGHAHGKHQANNVDSGGGNINHIVSSTTTPIQSPAAATDSGLSRALSKEPKSLFAHDLLYELEENYGKCQGHYICETEASDVEQLYGLQPGSGTGTYMEKMFFQIQIPETVAVGPRY